jgi:hypothetical protein
MQFAFRGLPRQLDALFSLLQSQRLGIPRSFLTHFLAANGVSPRDAAAWLADPKGAAEAYRASCSLEIESWIGERCGADSPLARDLTEFGNAVQSRGGSIELDRCESDDGGTFAVSVHSRGLPAKVRNGDVMLAGVVFVGETATGQCEVAPRLFRVACTNGAMLPIGVAEGETHYLRDAGGEAQGTVREAVDASLSMSVLRRSVEVLQAAATTPVTRALEALALNGIRVPHLWTDSVRRSFRRQDDPTLYGAFNATTEVARDLPVVAERVRLERLAGALIGARLLDPIDTLAVPV